MDDVRFDRLTRLLATSAPRRLIAGAAIGGLLSAVLGGDAAGKKKRKKKKKKPPCTPPCGVNVCTPACTGNKVCQPNGVCGCPTGLKECQGPGLGDNCHECCPDAFSGGGDGDCEGNPKGAYCKDLDNDGELILTCGCFSTATTCPNGTCGGCCRVEDCFLDVFGTGPVDTGRDCVVGNQETGEYACRCRSGTYSCPSFTFCAEPGNVRACGANCDDCNFGQPYQNYVCEGNPERCCLPTGSPCAFDNERCCSGPAACVLNAQGTTFVCS